MQALNELEIDLVGGGNWIIEVVKGVITSAVYDSAVAAGQYVVDGVMNPQNYDTSFTQYMDPMGNYTGVSTSSWDEPPSDDGDY